VEHCGSCHRDGGVGPGDWTDAAAATAASAAIAAVVESGQMPLPSADPACRDYHGSGRLTLDADERELLLAWAAAGAPTGEIADRPGEVAVHEPVLADTDLELRAPFTHTVDPDASGNDHFCFVLDNPLTAPTWVTGIDVELGDASVVHHMLLAVDLSGDAGSEYGDDDSSDGFACADPVVESDWMLVHAWTPGMEPVEFPEDHGMLLMPGQQLVLQMHYYLPPGLPAVEDQSAYRLRTSDAVSRPVEMWVAGPDRFTIPAGDAAYSAEDSARNGGGPVDILGAFPHMHWLGASYRAWTSDGDSGEERCLLEGDYDFDHQMTYMFTEPAVWDSGDRLHFQCTWDNSAANPDQPHDPPEDVGYGEGTDEEMCFLLFYVAQ
jgi:hypothetical protein